MTDSTETENPYVRPGEQVHVLVPLNVKVKPGFTGSSMLLDRSATITMTADLIAAQRDRFGKLADWLALLGDDEAQVARFGEIVSRPGPAPADLKRWVVGDATWRDERAKARAAAWAETDPDERDRRLREVQKVFGPDIPLDGTLQYRNGTPSERAAAAQEAEFARQRATGAR
ncbi:hypothetical protein ACIGEP_06120 [Microbacterium sp. NPDC077663]|uniref:hypothetical protein n=1 Tax=Microbacterium sp. NPDC077663 TaxID=3364189 RepID=UPI0037C88847